MSYSVQAKIALISILCTLCLSRELRDSKNASWNETADGSALLITEHSMETHAKPVGANSGGTPKTPGRGGHNKNVNNEEHTLAQDIPGRDSVLLWHDPGNSSRTGSNNTEDFHTSDYQDDSEEGARVLELPVTPPTRETVTWDEIDEAETPEALSLVHEVPVLDWSQINSSAYAAVSTGFGCLGKETCRRASSNASDPSLLNYVKFVHTMCFCDAACVRYGDCCLDMATRRWGSGPELDSDHWTCQLLQEPSYVYMVADCPAEYPRADVVHRCLKTVPDDQYTPLLDVPAYSLNTSTMYSNYFCAMCNGDTSTLAKWNASVECSTNISAYLEGGSVATFLQTARYLRGKRQWHKLLGQTETGWETAVNCYLFVEEFSTLGGGGVTLRRCRHNVVRTCDPSWVGLADRVKCAAYSWIVKGTESAADQQAAGGFNTPVIQYKNPHCAKCNYQNVSDCWSKALTTPPPPSQPRFAVSAAVLFDFYGEHVGLAHPCSGDQIWDSLFEQCFTVHCGVNYVMTSSGDCELSPDAVNVSDSIHSTCLKIALVPAQYAPTDNGTIYVYVLERYLGLGQFEQHDDQVLVCAAQPTGDMSFKHNAAQGRVWFVCVTISVVCLCAHILVHTCFSKLRNLPAKNLLSLSCALLLAQLLYLTGIHQSEIFSLCFLLAISIHYFFLASFFWMSVMSVDVCRAFTSTTYRPDARRKSFRVYSLYAWGLPALIVGAAILVDKSHFLIDYRPRYATYLCWLNHPPAVGLFFALPVGAVILENSILFCITVNGIYRQTRASRYAMTRSQSFVKSRGGGQRGREGPVKESPRPPLPMTSLTSRQARTEKIRFALYLKLALLMGLGWTCGFAACFGGPDWLWYPFLVFNGLQGTFIFMAFDLKRKVLGTAVERLTGRRPRWASLSKDSGQSSGTLPRTAVLKLSQSSQESLDARIRKLPSQLRSRLVSSGSGPQRRVTKRGEAPDGDKTPGGQHGASSPPGALPLAAMAKTKPAKRDSPHQRRSRLVRAEGVDEPLLLKLVSHSSARPPLTSPRSPDLPISPSRSPRHRNRPDRDLDIGPLHHEGDIRPGRHERALIGNKSRGRASQRRTRDDLNVGRRTEKEASSRRRAGSCESIPTSVDLDQKIFEAKRLLRRLAEQPQLRESPRKHSALKRASGWDSKPEEKNNERRSRREGKPIHAGENDVTHRNKQGERKRNSPTKASAKQRKDMDKQTKTGPRSHGARRFR